MLRAALKLLADGEAVRKSSGRHAHSYGLLHAARPGIAMLVQKSGVPVLPCALILGTYEMLPRGRKLPRFARLKVVFGKPLTFSPDATREK